MQKQKSRGRQAAKSASADRAPQARERIAAHPAAAEDIDRRLRVLLDQTRGAVLRVRDRELAPAGISTIEAAVLYTLEHAENPVTPSTISRWIRREPHATSKLLQRMERKGLVAKSRDLKQGNLVRVVMTDRGRKAYEFSLQEESTGRLMASFSDDEKVQLDSLLRKLLQTSQTELAIGREAPYP
jgi:DNA-binding MarR family transcriptional regulator